MPKLFCFGLGYTAGELARRLAAKGWRVGGTHRDPAALEAARAEGMDAFLFTGAAPMDDIDRALGGASHLLVSIRPFLPGEAADEAWIDPVLTWHGKDLAARKFDWVGYLSSTVVYGDHAGAWVGEDGALNTRQERGSRRIAAERAWLDLGQTAHLPVHIFRLAGIYGPGRNAFVSLETGKAARVEKAGHVTSRIHVADAARVLEASIARPRAGAVYNVADDLPCAQTEPLDYAARLLGLPPAPTVQYEKLARDSYRRKFFIENRRVKNERIKSELGVTLAYPTYREGLDALYTELQKS